MAVMADGLTTGYDPPMRRAPSLVLLATIAAAVVSVGCQPPDQAGGPVVVDAGAAPVVVDAGVVAAVVVVDAGSDEVPTVATLVDAGTMADPPAAPPPPPATASADVTHPVGSFIYDRLLVQPKETSERPDALQKRIEKTLGQKVKSLRRTAGTFWLVQLAPVTPARTKLDQARAIERLQKTGTFKNVEGDQLMTIKTGLKTPTLR